MDYDRLWMIADLARSSSRRLSPEDQAFVRDEVPRDLQGFPGVELPKRVSHPAGFTLTGAPVGTLLRGALLIAGQKILGKRYGEAGFYQAVERDLAFGIMRSHFHHGYPKGVHCCAQCSYAIYPVLSAGAIRYFECSELSRELRRLIEAKKWRFAGSPNPPMVRWSLATS